MSRPVSQVPSSARDAMGVEVVRRCAVAPQHG
jgi:hypothetical protein